MPPPQTLSCASRAALEGLDGSGFSGSSYRGPAAAMLEGRQFMSAAEEKIVQKFGPNNATDAPLKRDIRESAKHREAMERVRKLGQKYAESLKKLAE